MKVYLIILSALFSVAVDATYQGSDQLLKQAKDKIALEFQALNPFWTNTMIPVIVFLAIILLAVSIFAVSLIAIKALNEPEPAFATFAPPGFDALWERNIQAELGLRNKQPLETIDELEEIKSESLAKETRTESSLIPKIPILSIKAMKIDSERANYPFTAPKPVIATNSKTGLD